MTHIYTLYCLVLRLDSKRTVHVMLTNQPAHIHEYLFTVWEYEDSYETPYKIRKT